MNRTFDFPSLIATAILHAVAVFAASSAQAKPLEAKYVTQDETFRYYMLKTTNGEEVGWKVENTTRKLIHVNRIVVRYQCSRRDAVRKRHVIYRKLKYGQQGGTGLSFPCGVGGKITSAKIEGVVFNEAGIPHNSNKLRCDDGSTRSYIFAESKRPDKYLKIVVPRPGRDIKHIIRKDTSRGMVDGVAEALCGATQSPTSLSVMKRRLRRYLKAMATKHKKACAADPNGPDCKKAKLYKSHAACMCVRG